MLKLGSQKSRRHECDLLKWFTHNTHIFNMFFHKFSQRDTLFTQHMQQSHIRFCRHLQVTWPNRINILELKFSLQNHTNVKAALLVLCRCRNVIPNTVPIVLTHNMQPESTLEKLRKWKKVQRKRNKSYFSMQLIEEQQPKSTHQNLHKRREQP